MFGISRRVANPAPVEPRAQTSVSGVPTARTIDETIRDLHTRIRELRAVVNGSRERKGVLALAAFRRDEAAATALRQLDAEATQAAGDLVNLELALGAANDERNAEHHRTQLAGKRREYRQKLEAMRLGEIERQDRLARQIQNWIKVGELGQASVYLERMAISEIEAPPEGFVDDEKNTAKWRAKEAELAERRDTFSRVIARRRQVVVEPLA